MIDTSAPLDGTEPPDVEEPLPTSWDELDADQSDAMQHFFDTHPVGKKMYWFANYNRNFAMWLTAVYAEHWSAVVRPLEGLDHPKWRMRHDSRWTPQEAVHVETAPCAVIKDQHLVCPRCDAAGQIVEINRAESTHELTVNDEGGITANDVRGDFHHLLFRCDSCKQPVTVPGEVTPA